MKVSELLVEALDAVNESKIPNDLRVVAFAKAMEVLASQRNPAAAAATPAAAIPGSTSPKGSPIEAISTRLGIDSERLREVFNVTEGGEIELVFPAGKIERKLSSGTKQIALLVAAARQATALDEWTSFANIRAWCEHYKRLDGANFATTVKQMEDIFSIRGAGQKREVRMTRPGWEKATELVNSIIGGGES